MTKQLEPDTSDSQPDLLDQLSPDDALAVLRILAQDAALSPRVRQVAAAYVEESAPKSEEDIEDVAEALRFDLEQLQVEDIWDRSGRTRYGYVEPHDVAGDLFQAAIEPYQADISRYQSLGLTRESTYLLMGMLLGLYRFEHESVTKFKEWAIDAPIVSAQLLLEEYRDSSVTRAAVEEIRTFIQEYLPLWAHSLADSLPAPTSEDQSL